MDENIMNNIPILYSVNLKRIIQILQLLQDINPRGMEIEKIFTILDYNDSTGRSMHIRFLEENNLIEREQRYVIKISESGIIFLKTDDETKYAYFRDHLSRGLISILEFLAYAKDNILPVENVFKRLESLYGSDKDRVMEAKMAFTKEYLKTLNLIEIITKPIPSFKLTSIGHNLFKQKINKGKDNMNKAPFIDKNQNIEAKTDSQQTKLPLTINEIKATKEIQDEKLNSKVISSTDLSASNNNSEIVNSIDSLKEDLEIDNNNTQEENTSIDKKTRTKSIRYPAVSLEEAVAFSQRVARLAGNGSVTESTLMADMDVTNKATKKYSYVKSSAEQFNLIERADDGGFRLTILGKKLSVTSLDDPNRRKAILDAFYSPQIFQILFKRFLGFSLPDDNSLKNILIGFGITETSVNQALQAFKDSANYANAIENGKFMPFQDGESENTPIVSDNLSPTVQIEKKPVEIEDSISPRKMNLTDSEIKKPFKNNLVKGELSSDYHRIEFSTISGKIASIIIPKDATKEDIDKIKNLLDIIVK